MPKQTVSKKDLWLEQFQAGYDLVEQHPLFALLLRHKLVCTNDSAIQQTRSYAYCSNSSTGITVNRKMRLLPEQWAYVLAHQLLHYALWHFEEREDPVRWGIACDMYISRFLRDAGLFRPPEGVGGEPPYPATSEESLYIHLLDVPLGNLQRGFSTSDSYTDFRLDPDFH